MGVFEDDDLLVLPKTNEKIEKFINYIMRDGKKNLARKIFYKALGEIKENGHMNPKSVWRKAIENASPEQMVKSKRIGGAVYQIPLDVSERKKFFYASKWILNAAREKDGKKMYKKLADEILAAYSNQGKAVNKKEESHRMAEANKAYAYLAKYVS